MLPRPSIQYSRRRIMVKEPNGNNHWATYLEDEDECEMVFKTKEEAEEYIKNHLE